MKYAGFWRRFAATFIDCLIFAFVPGVWGDNETASGLSFILFGAYEVWMNGAYGATVGKMVMKLKITKENGSKITYQDAALRYFASLLSAVALGLGYFWMLWDPKKQTWHDKLAKTIVVKA